MFARVLAVLAFAFFAVATMRFALADTPASDPAAKPVEAFHAALLDVMKRGRELGIQGRYRALQPTVEATFNLPLMTQFVVGPTWSSMSDADHNALIEAFRRMTIANYASNFDSFNGQKFTMDASVLQKGNDKFVQTALVPNGDKPVLLIYRMRDTGNGWKIIDVLLEGFASELATRRSDFSTTIASGGAQALVKKMNELSDNLLSGSKKGTP